MIIIQTTGGDDISSHNVARSRLATGQHSHDGHLSGHLLMMPAVGTCAWPGLAAALVAMVLRLRIPGNCCWNVSAARRRLVGCLRKTLALPCCMTLVTRPRVRPCTHSSIAVPRSCWHCCPLSSRAVPGREIHFVTS